MKTSKPKANKPTSLGSTATQEKPWATGPQKQKPLTILIIDGNWIDGLFIEMVCKAILPKSVITRPYNIAMLKTALKHTYDLLILDTKLDQQENELLHPFRLKHTGHTIIANTTQEQINSLPTDKHIIKTESAEALKLDLTHALLSIQSIVSL